MIACTVAQSKIHSMKKLLALSTILCTTLFFVSCKKDDVTANANLMIVNASPNGSNVDASVNGSVVASNLAYPNHTDYKTVASGTNNITITQSGSSTQVINGSTNFDAGSYYSFYVVDSSNKRKPLILKDDLSAPSAGKAKIRILHLSPNTPAIDISITGSGSAAINSTNRSFNDVQTNTAFAAFQEVDAAGLTLTVKAAGSSTTLVSVPIPALTAGKIYTIIIKGFTTGTATQALGVEVIQHN
jgi:hypothetical protein